jgi:hypothetical protein
MSTESSGSNEVEITRPPRIRRDVWTPFDGRYAEPIPEDRTEIEKLQKLTLAERAILTYEEVKLKTRIAILIAPHVFTIIRGKVMKNWKTTVTGIIGAIAVVAQSIFGVVIPQEAILAVTVFVVSLFASDNK